MSISFDDLIVKTDTLISAQGSAPSTLMQYRWAWAKFQSFCSDDGNPILTDEVVDRYLQFVAGEHRAGRFKDWKAKLLRKSVLVLWEVATMDSYQWRISRQSHPNDGLNTMLRPVQEQFETWLEHQELAEATQHLHATVSRTILAELPTLGVDTITALTAADVAAAVVFLGHRYRPGSMRTVLSACGSSSDSSTNPSCAQACAKRCRPPLPDAPARAECSHATTSRSSSMLPIRQHRPDSGTKRCYCWRPGPGCVRSTS